MKIVVLDGYTIIRDSEAATDGLSWGGLEKLGELTAYDRTAPEEVLERSQGADALLTNKVVLSASILRQLSQLKYIGVLATGYNVVDIDAAHELGITVTNVPAYSTESVAQATFAHILNLTNRVGYYAAENRAGRWAKQSDFCYYDTPLTDLCGKTLGVVGLGHIGMRVANLACQFGMDVFAVTSKHPADLPQGIQKTTLEGLLSVSDVLTLHCPLTDKTKHLINSDTLRKTKKGAIIINTSRGALVDETALASALNDGWIAGYGADVLSQEPPAPDNELLACPNAFITPHIAWASVESRRRLVDTAVNNLKAFILHHPVNNL